MDVSARQSRFVGGSGYAPLSDATIRQFLASIPHVAEMLEGAPHEWSFREVGDGNLNLVFIVKGRQRGVVIKQALPYVRLVGESWPLPLDRAFFEYQAMQIEAAAAPGLVPRQHHFDRVRAASIMELLEPHIILRKGLIKGTIYPRLAGDMAEFAAATLFSTSDLGSPAAEKRERQALFSQNIALCKITEDLVFTDPYRIADMNRWTSPQLDAIAGEFRSDALLKVAVQELKWAFLSRGEALLHGDLHTGSVMVTQEDTRVIDPEFGFYGPMGFDPGAFMANLLLAYFAQAGHARDGDDRVTYRNWILDTLESFWSGFESRFLARWRKGGGGDAFPAPMFADVDGSAALEEFRRSTMVRVFIDATGFAGAKMARRILGLAHVEDFESIADRDVRAACETRALRMARTMMVERARIGSIGAIRSLAESIAASKTP